MNKEIRIQEKIKNNSLGSDIFISFIITFAAGVFCYENYMPEKFMKIFSASVLIICIATWLGISFVNGVKQRWQYEVFTALFWLIPPLIIYLSNDGAEFFRMSIFMYLLAEFSEFISTAPAENVGQAAGLSALSGIIIILLMCLFAFLGGLLLSLSNSEKQSKR